MKIKFLGTAAAEGWPAMFCKCPACEKARKAGGKNIRTRAQAVIDDSLLIDFGPDTYMHVINHGLDLTKIKSLLITHSHSDHFNPSDMGMRQFPYSNTLDFPMNIYGNMTVMKRIIDAFYVEDLNDIYGDILSCNTMKNKEIPNTGGNLILNSVDYFDEFTTGDYQITAIPANHNKKENCLIYLIKKGDKTILYAHDTGFLSDDALKYLSGKQIDLVTMDCTLIVENDGQNHMGLYDTVEFKNRLIKAGAVKPDTTYIINHFSHNGQLIYDELEPKAKELGLITTYDGFEIEI